MAILLIIFFSQQIVKISNSLFEQRATAFILERRNDAIGQLREDFKAIGESDNKIKNAFPPADNILDFISAMETLANSHSIPQSLRFGALAGDYIDYNIQLNANISIFINYLKSFEKLSYFTSISGISLSSSGDLMGDSAISLGARIYTTPIE